MKNTRTKKKRFYQKYYLYFAFLILSAFVVFGMMMLLLISNHWWNEKKTTLGENCQIIAENYIDLIGNEKNASLVLGNNIATLSKSTQTDFFICDKDGKVIICPDYLKKGEKVCSKHSVIVINSELTERAKAEIFASFTRIEGRTRDSFVVGCPVISEGETVAEVFAVVDAITGLLPYVGSVLRMIGNSSLISLLVAFWAIYIYTSKLMKPLADMIEATDRYAKGDFSYHVKTRGSSKDMDEMATALNRMVDQLAVDNEAQKSFVANVSHELKTPMTTIIGFVDGILDGTIPKESQENYLTIVSNEVKRLSRLVVTMLNLSKIESGEISIQPVKYSLSSQVLDSLLAMEQRIEKGQIEIEGMENIADVTLYGDKDLLHQVIYNLLDNAVKFTPPHEKIIILAKKNEKSTTVTIRNTGVSLTQEDTARIFERFYKVDKSRSYDIKGVGLGLYIVKTIVNMHDGTIEVDSKSGEYVEFRFTLPNK